MVHSRAHAKRGKTPVLHPYVEPILGTKISLGSDSNVLSQKARVSDHARNREKHNEERQ